MKSISIMWSPGVQELEAQITVAALHEALSAIYGPARNRHLSLFTPEVHPFGNWSIPNLPPDTPYQSAKWYFEQTGGPGDNQIDGDMFLQTVLQEPWQTTAPHYDLAITEQELIYSERGEQRGSLMGMAISGSAAVTSVAPLRSIINTRSRLLALRRLVLHFAGHMFGLPSPFQPSDLEPEVPRAGEGKQSKSSRHCSELCVMRYAPSVEILLAHAIEELHNRAIYCSDCRRKLLSLLIGDYFGMN